MSLITYEQVRPFARAVKQKTALRDKPGVMPPWFIEKSVGIQGFMNDPSLSDLEIATIGAWVDAGAPEGDPAHMPPPVAFRDLRSWTLGEPDLVVSSPAVTVEGSQPDWWGQLGSTPTRLTEDRYIKSSEIREVNDIPPGTTLVGTVGGLNVFHHASVTIIGPDGKVDPTSTLPAHEVGRNADEFDPEAGRLIRAGSVISFNNNHLHANGRETTARLEVGLRFHPKGYKPTVNFRGIFFGTTEIDLKGNEDSQRVDAYYTLPENGKIMNFEPHMHAPAVRMCVEAIYGHTITTLNCSGYDHTWVRNYQYLPDSAPLLPKGTILHITGWFDTTAKNRNMVDYRNWTGGGNRSVDNMFINLSYMTVMTDEEFRAAVSEREAKIQAGKAEAVGCLTCFSAQPTTLQLAQQP
ncbi:MAG: hypothetical protein FJW23_12880 [Acidimicrobiia bacterium]|nr:hypothetical protein [Acidimicrobiia bacterium]